MSLEMVGMGDLQDVFLGVVPVRTGALGGELGALLLLAHVDLHVVLRVEETFGMLEGDVQLAVCLDAELVQALVLLGVFQLLAEDEGFVVVALDVLLLLLHLREDPVLREHPVVHERLHLHPVADELVGLLLDQVQDLDRERLPVQLVQHVLDRVERHPLLRVEVVALQHRRYVLHPRLRFRVTQYLRLIVRHFYLRLHPITIIYMAQFPFNS